MSLRIHRDELVVLGVGVAVGALFLAGCGGSRKTSTAQPATRPSASSPPTRSTSRRAARTPARRSVSSLHLPRVDSRILPGYLLVADRNNDRVLLISPQKRVVWRVDGLQEPDDAFFTPGYRGVITNEEFANTLTEISLVHAQRTWSYGHANAAGSAPGYLDAPDDAYRLADGVTTVADIKNCRIVEVRRNGTVLRVLGGSCTHDPPRGFASPNGDTPLGDGGLLVTEIGGWIDRLDRTGGLVWSVRSPISYPSDAQLLPNGRILVCGFTTPGKVVELTRAGHIAWSFGSSSGVDRLDRPSLAIRLPNGLIAVNDDWRHRVILIDPRSKRIVWQYGHTDVASAAPGYLSKPDGMDFLPASDRAPAVAANVSRSADRSHASALLTVARAGSLPTATSRLSAVALSGGRIVALGGIAHGTSSSAVLAGPPARLRQVGALPAPTHDAAAVLIHGRVELLGGGRSVSTPDVTLFDPTKGEARILHPLDEPLSDLGAAVVRGHVYLVGGYTGSRFASAVLRVGSNGRTTTVARLPTGVRYAGVAALQGWIFVAGGVTPAGATRDVYRIDVRSRTVKLLAALPQPIAHAPLVAARGYLWLIGGDGSRDVLRIDPTGRKTVVAARLPRVLANAAAVSLPQDRIAVIGGDGSDAVWVLSPRSPSASGGHR
jgi:hypothetical protein